MPKNKFHKDRTASGGVQLTRKGGTIATAAKQSPNYSKDPRAARVGTFSAVAGIAKRYGTDAGRDFLTRMRKRNQKSK